MRQLSKYNKEDHIFYEFKFKESIDFLNFGKFNADDRWGPKELDTSKYMTSEEMIDIKEAIHNNPDIVKDFMIITNKNSLEQNDQGYVNLKKYLSNKHEFYNIKMPPEYFTKRSITEEEYKSHIELLPMKNIYNFHKIDKDISYTSIRVGSITEANEIINEGINQGWLLISHEVVAGDSKYFIQMKRKNNGSI